MQRNFLEIFKGKLNTHRIQTKVLALEAGRNASYLSEVFTGKKSPTLETFTSLLEAADRLSPGFADEYYLALVGHVDLDNFVSSLSSNELAVVLMNVSQRIRKLGLRETAIAS
jgi:hypothetical protein